MLPAIDDMPLPDVMAELVATGIVTMADGRYDLTEWGAQIVAEENGWQRGEDDDGDECFVDTATYSHFSYVTSWRDLVALKGLAQLSRTSAEIFAP